MPETGFSFHVGPSDWDDAKGGWRCPALQIPGAAIDALYYGGTRADPANYRVEHGVVRWLQRPPPDTASIAVTLTRDLSKEIPDLERSKVRWQAIAVVLGFIGTLAGLFVPRLSAKAGAAPEEILTCRQDLKLVESLSDLPSADADSLRRTIKKLATCQKLMQRLDGS